jgi:hypothetical protein
MALRIERRAEPIPGYRLLERLGSGGFGEVWKCQAPGGLLKALKIVRGAADPDAGPARGRPGLAAQELTALRRVQAVRHPYLLSIDRYDIIDGRLLIVTELADGSLWDRFRDCRAGGRPGIPRDDLLRYLLEAAEVLDLMRASHQLQHLDVKPQNLFLVHDHVKVGDFGLVSDLQGFQAQTSGAATPFYAAPETFDDALSRHCDQYSLAVVYQELLTGVRPFAGGSMQEVIFQHLQAAPNLSPLPPADRPAVARALSKRPDDRFPSCTAFVRALESGLGYRGAEFSEPVDTPTARAGDEPTATNLPKVSAPDTPMPDPPAPREAVLAPAVVIGLGGTGRAVLQRLRRTVADHLGPPEHWPHLRLLYIDTDADAVRAALDAAALAPDEVLPARLQRVGHYLKQQADGRSLLGGWLAPSWLDRLPDRPAPDGSRGLGRLAFADHYRALAEKLEGDLAAVTRPDALARAAAATGLGVRSDRPRVYVVTHVAGGTGGGLFLDVAYLARHLLRRLGDPTPDVAGWLLVPPAGADAPALANTYAALTELRHFSRPDTTYRARCDDPDGCSTTRDAPFDRLVVLPQDGPGLAADGLARDLLTPFGRAADERRDAAGRGPPGADCRTFGAARFAWPRRAMKQPAACRLARALLERWAGTDAGPVRAAVHAWVAEQWAALGLGPDPLTRRLRQACAEELGRPPEEAFAALAASRTDGRAPSVLDVLVRVEELVGRPADETSPGVPGRLAEALARATDGLMRDWGGRLAQLTVCLIEQPDFRLAGAETAVRALHELLTRALAHVGPLADDWLRKSDLAGAHISALLADDGQRSLAGLAEAVRLYPRWRYQGLVLRQAAAIYGALCGQLADELTEVGLCRRQLAAALAVVCAREAGERAGDGPDDAAGRLLPDGCRTAAEAVERLLGAVTRDDLRELDRRAQQMLQERSGGLARACLESDDPPQTLGPALVEVAVAFLGPRLGAADAAEAFLTRHPGPAAAEALAAAWAAAAPALAPAGSAELAALALPPGPAATTLADLARQTLSLSDPLVTPSPGDVVLVREQSRLPLAALPALGPEARAAYRQLLRTEGFSPHARADIADWGEVAEA